MKPVHQTISFLATLVILSILLAPIPDALADDGAAKVMEEYQSTEQPGAMHCV